LSAGRDVESAEDVEQRRLAAPRWTEQHHELAAVEIEVDLAQRVHFDLADAVHLGDATRAEYDLGQCSILASNVARLAPVRLASLQSAGYRSERSVGGATVKVLWAFNPFDGNRKLQQRALAIVKALAGARDHLEAVYVASPVEIDLATAFDVPVGIRFASYPKSLVEQALRKLGLKQIRATVLTHDSLSMTASARALAAHAAREKADLTLVASHARKGVSRLFLGSFAETLVHLSKTDLLVFHETTRAGKRAPKNLLFAHDLSRDGDRGFEKALAYA